MKKIILFLMLVSLYSCSLNDDVQLLENVSNIAAAENTVSKYTKLDISTDNLKTFVSKYCELQGKEVPEYTMGQLKNTKGELYAYVVNFANDEGFVVVSATINYPPILAHSDKGHFEVELMNTGLNCWLQEASSRIIESKKKPDDSVKMTRLRWSQYQDQDLSAQIQKIKRSLPDEYYQLQQIFMDSVNRWISQGYKLYFYDTMSGLPSECRYLLTDCESNIYPLYEEWWTNLTVVREKGKTNTNATEVSTEMYWSQTNGFNQSYPQLSNGALAHAGCGPVAVGQIMRHYRHPSSYNWNDMPVNYATKTTSDFLYKIASSCSPTYGINGTSTSWSKLNDFLKSSGYNTSSAKYDEKLVLASIAQGRLVMMYGDDPKNSPHAWVCGGTSSISYSIEYDSWTFTSYKKLGRVYSKSLSTGIPHYEFYYNWGWATISNGYYAAGVFEPRQTNYDFSTDNKIIYNIYPK